MMRRRKDSGFTLIELMIVIAVIGILAIVLVPKIGTVKSQAKETGLDTNIRVIQGYVESKINKWVSNGATATEVQDFIVSAFTDTEKLTNPITSETTGAGTGDGLATGTPANNEPIFVLTTTDGADLAADPDTLKGTIVVAVVGNDPVQGVNIYAHDADGETVTTVNITP